jgi:hypothetical protein
MWEMCPTVRMIHLWNCRLYFDDVWYWGVYTLLSDVSLAAVKMSIMVFWDLTPCGLVSGYQRFGGMYRLHLQGKVWLLKICKTTLHQKPENHDRHRHRRDNLKSVSSPWSWRRYILPKRWWPPTRPHGVTTRNTSIDVNCILVIELKFCSYRSNITSTFHETKIGLRPIDFIESALSYIKLARGIKLRLSHKNRKTVSFCAVW